jgi:TonB family protein
MRRGRLTVMVLATMALAATGVPAPVSAQALGPGDDLVPVWLARPAYPVIPRAARLQGEVEVGVDVSADGSVASATIRSGHALFRDAVLDAARESRFMGRRADAPPAQYTLTYAFVFSDSPGSLGSLLIVGSGRARLMTVADTGIAIFHYSDIGVRGAKCLYLWRCGREWGGYTGNGYERTRSPACLWLWRCAWTRPSVIDRAPS